MKRSSLVRQVKDCSPVCRSLRLHFTFCPLLVRFLPIYLVFFDGITRASLWFICNSNVSSIVQLWYHNPVIIFLARPRLLWALHVQSCSLICSGLISDHKSLHELSEGIRGIVFLSVPPDALSVMILCIEAPTTDHENAAPCIVSNFVPETWWTWISTWVPWSVSSTNQWRKPSFVCS